MASASSIPFLIDEHLPTHLLGLILEARGHQASAVQISQRDLEILETADRSGAIVITADVWFLRELYRLPAGHRRLLRDAGVVQVAGEWPLARQRLRDYLPLIELIYRLRKSQRDRRVGIDLSPITTIRILEASRLAPGSRQPRLLP